MAKPNQRATDVRDSVSHNGDHPISSTSQDARALRSGSALRAALLALLERKPFEQITVREICAEAGVHYATFFRHHPTKEALLDHIARDQIAQLIRLTLGIRAASDYRAGVHALFAYVDEHRALWSTLLNGGAGAAMREEWVRQSKRVAATEAPANAWLPRELGTICAATLIAEVVAWWVAQPPGAYDVDEISDILFRMLSAAFMTPD